MGLRLGTLVASITANAVLGFLVFRPTAPLPAPATAAADASSPKSHERLVARPRPKEPTLPAAAIEPTVPPSPAFDWAQLESQDYKEYIVRLRAFGVPDRVIREIIIADVEKLYRPKLAALRPPPPTRTNFWEQSGAISSPRPAKEQREQARTLQREKQDLIKELLGKDVYQQISADAGYASAIERMFGSVSPEQRDQVSDIQERYQRMKADVYEENEYNVDEVARDQIRSIQRKMREELATVLTPEQVENYELRSSDLASNMRYELRSFEPNEEEFRAIFKYKQTKEDLETLRNANDGAKRDSREEMKSLQQKQKEMDEVLSQALSPDRAKEFKLSENYEYRNLFEAGVSKDSIFKLADLRQDVESAAARLRRDKALNEEQRKAALAAIRTETEKSMTDLLGERRARGYLGNGGYWLRSIAPKQ